jgi:hypothetical protein
MRSLAVLTIVLASYGLGRADDHAKADQLFEEAQKLKQSGRNGEACAKYAEALSYNRNAVGTLLNVALCNELGGKVATALELFTQARDLAREHNLAEHRKAAEEHIAAIEKLVPHLAITFAEKAPQMKLVIDDKVFPVEAAGDIRTDPGARHIVVTAPGRVPYETTVQLEAEKRTDLAVPALGHPVTVKSARRTVGKILTFSGVGLIGTSIVLGLFANDKYEAQFKPNKDGVIPCSEGNPPQCDAEGYAETTDARTYGTFGTVVGIAGGAALALGAYLWFFAPKDQVTTERALAITPTVTPESAGIAAVGRF